METLDAGILSPNVPIVPAGCRVESIDMAVSGGDRFFLLLFCSVMWNMRR